MRKGHEQMWTLSLEWRSFPLSPCSWLWEKHKTLWRFETNHLEWETENQKPQQKRRVCKEFVRTTGVDYCVSRNWKNHLRCWKGGVSFWMWPMEEIKSKSYQRFVNLNTLLNVAEYWKKTKHKTYFKFASSVQFSSIQFSCSVVSDSLRPHELQHSRPPCPSPTPGVHSKSCPLSRWCHPAISSSVILLFLPPIPSSIRVLSTESTLCMRWPKYWSFSFSIIPSNEHPGLISFRMGWLDLLAVQETLKSLFQRHNLKASILQHSACFLESSNREKKLNSLWTESEQANGDGKNWSLGNKILYVRLKKQTKQENQAL